MEVLTRAGYISEVEEFVDLYTTDYFNPDERTLVHDDTELMSTLTVKTSLYEPRHEWTVRLGVEDDQLVIYTDETREHWVNADGEGLYTVLFFEAVKRIEERHHADEQR